MPKDKLLYRKLNKGCSDTTGGLLRGMQAFPLKGNRERSYPLKRDEVPMDKIVHERKRVPILFVVGIGPGAKGYITEIAKKIIKNADLVAGFKPAINIIRDLINKRAEIVVLDYASEKLKLNMIISKLSESKRCVICCVGDPNFSDQQFIKKIRSACGQIEVIPGISSGQIAAAMAGLAMEDVRFITFHKSGSLKAQKLELIEALKVGKNIILLPRPWDFMPQDIAKFLIRKGIPPKIGISVYENLTLENEAVFGGSLEDISGKDFSDLSIMIIKQNRL